MIWLDRIAMIKDTHWRQLHEATRSCCRAAGQIGYSLLFRIASGEVKINQLFYNCLKFQLKKHA